MSTNPRRLSFWWESLPDELAGPARPALPGPTSVDVAIVGAGYTGLWTAYYLAKADPSLSIAVLESETAGFGASGRNGGWASALFPTSLDTVAAASSRESAIALQRLTAPTPQDQVALSNVAMNAHRTSLLGGNASQLVLLVIAILIAIVIGILAQAAGTDSRTTDPRCTTPSW